MMNQRERWNGFYRRGHLAHAPELFVVRLFRSLMTGGEFLDEQYLRDWQRPNLCRVLDFGCGNGRHLDFLAFEGWDVSACDASAEAVRLASQGLHATADLVDDELPYGDGQFGIVLAHGVFDHIPTAERPHWIGEVARVLAPGGLVCASFMAHSAHAGPIGEEAILETGEEAGLSQTTFTTWSLRREWEPTWRFRSIAYDNRGVSWPAPAVVEHRLWAFIERA